MRKIKFCHICPTKHILHAAANSGSFMALEFLTKDPKYVESFRTLRSEGGYVYLDNNQFEKGRPCDIDALLKAAKLIDANCIILPDGDLTHLDYVKSKGFEVMYIPSAPDLEVDFLEAMHNKKIDKVGLSYTKTSAYLGRTRHSSSSRFDFLSSIGEMLPAKKIHMLGMVTPGEIALMRPFIDLIYSWDSSVAIWGGLKHINIRNMAHKNLDPVDFDSELHWGSVVDSNIDYINQLLEL